MVSVEEKLDKIIYSLQDIEERLVKLEKTNEGIQHDCSKMNDHITFIEYTYSVVKKPLEYIINLTQFKNKLPELKNN